MSLLTSFLKLFKWNTTDETDLEQEFDIDTSMNDNWDKLDEAIEDLDTNKVDKVDGKGLSTNDFTNEDKEKLDSLENYDDTEITQEIEDIQEEQAKQNEDIEDLKQINAKQDDLIQKLKDNSINVTTEEATSLHVENASTVPARLEVRGNHSQKTREGYNLFNKDDVSNISTSLGSIRYSDNKITTPALSAYSWIKIFEEISFEPGTYYLTFIVKLISGTALSFNAINVNNDISGIKEIKFSLISNSINNSAQTIKAKLELSSALDIQNIFLQLSGSASNAVLEISEIMLTSKEDAEYENFGAMPSLDYPSEVRAVGDNVNVFKDIIYNNFVVNNSAKKEATGTEIKVTTIAISNCRNIFR